MSNLLGQHMIIGFEGTKPSEELLSFIRDEKIGGVILFKRNIKSLKQVKNLIKELQEAADGRLLVSVDHEGGRVYRFGNLLTHFPCALQLAKQGEHVVYNAGKTMAEELYSLGINLDFAPVLDVVTNSFNDVIGDRSFSSDPTEVAELSIQMIKGFIDSGIIPCGKHFPGHGDTDLDSHLALPMVQHTRKRFDFCELHPFKVAIAAGIPMIMTAHVLAPNLDEKWPVTISKSIVSGILRKELGFEGVIITDDLNMKGISYLMSIPDAACKAIEAGHDMVMICNGMDIQKATLEKLKKASDEGRFARLEDRAERIDFLKKSFNLW